MSQAHTYNPVAVPSLRLVPARATDSLKESVPSANSPPLPNAAPPQQAANPKPQAVPYERLLTLYLDPTLSLADIAFTLGRSIAETLLLTTEKDFKTLLAFYSEAHEQRAAFLARCNIDKATRAFVRLVDTTDKPETARKAAGAIVRLQQESKPRQITPELSFKAATTLLHYRAPGATGGSSARAPRAPAMNNSPHRAAERRQPAGRGESPG